MGFCLFILINVAVIIYKVYVDIDKRENLCRLLMYNEHWQNTKKMCEYIVIIMANQDTFTLTKFQFHIEFHKELSI